MVNWTEPSVVAFCSFIYNQNAVFLLGFFANHVLTRLDIEWSLIRRKRRFSLVLIPYLFGRYALLLTLLMFVSINRFQFKIANCDATYRALAFLGSSASSCATLNLGIRSYIIWKDMNRLVVWALSLGCIGHAVLVIIQAFLSVTFTWDTQVGSCNVVKSSNITMFVFYLYTIIMDLTIVILTICGLWKKAALRSAIGHALSEQCLWYCVGTFVCNIPAVIFPILNLNVITNVIASMPAATFSVIMSSAAVLSLKSDDVNPERRNNQSTAAQLARELPRSILGSSLQVVSHHVTLTTNITFDSHTESSSSDVMHTLQTVSRKTTEDAIMDAV